MPVTREDIALVERVASRFVRKDYSSDRDDVVSDGMLVLERAVTDWEGDRALRARWGERERASFIVGRVKRGMIDGLRIRNGHKRTGFGRQRLRENTVSLDAQTDTDYQPSTFGERFVGELDIDLEHVLDRGVVEQLLEALPPREREVVERSIVDGETDTSIAKDLGLHASRISQIRSQALSRLRGENVPMPREPKPGLTERELEILQSIADDMTNREIAAKLFVSEETVKSHVRHIHQRFGCNSRAGAVAIGFRRQLIS